MLPIAIRDSATPSCTRPPKRILASRRNRRSAENCRKGSLPLSSATRSILTSCARQGRSKARASAATALASSHSSASSDRIQSPLAASIAVLRAREKSSCQTWAETLAPSERAISTVRSRLPVSTTMTSLAKSRTDSIARRRFTSSSRTIMQTDKADEFVMAACRKRRCTAGNSA